MGDNELGIYEGCYVELRNGEVVGPVNEHQKNGLYQWRVFLPGVGWKTWTNSGTGRDTSGNFDIIRVIDDESPAGMSLLNSLPDATKATIPTHVLQAAMGAGIKADPAYEQFVSAILEAGIAAMGDVQVVGQPEVDMDVLCEEISSGLPGEKGFLERPYGSQEHIRNIAGRMISFFGRSADPKNESENRIQDSEKPKGGLSQVADLPLSDITIVFTGNTIMPRDTLKGIAESLGAKVTGSVHRHTTLVVYGPGAGSKLEKANEFSLPRMSEEAWLWVAGRLGYGKPEQVSPYGKLSAKTTMVNPYTLTYAQTRMLDDVKHSARDDLVTVLRSMAANAGSVLFSHRQKLKAAADEIERLRGCTIPSPAMIDETIRQCVTEWRKTDNGTAFTPPSRYIAGAVHKMLVDRAPTDTAGFVPPSGWTLEEERHSLINDKWEHTVRLILGNDPEIWAEGKADNLRQAWDNARRAARDTEMRTIRDQLAK